MYVTIRRTATQAAIIGTTETSTWADGGRKFGELMEKATGGKVKVNIYAADQLTNGNQSAQVLVSVVEHAKFHVISGQSRSL